MKLLKYMRMTIPVLTSALLGVVLLSCGNFATEADIAGYSDGDSDADSDSDSDSDGDGDGDGDADGDIGTDTDGGIITPVDTDVDSDADVDISVDTDWPCPVSWNTYRCTTEAMCLSHNGVVPEEYSCEGGRVCCDTTPVVVEGPAPCPTGEPNISCQFSWECWKAGGKFNYNDYFCEGDNTLCCISEKLDSNVDTDSDTISTEDTDSDTDTRADTSTLIDTAMDSETKSDTISVTINITSFISECGGLSDKARAEALSDSWNKPYCDAEVVHWKYDAAIGSLALLDSRVLLNCCGDHGLTMARQSDGTYLVTETDRTDTADRCNCLCVYDYQLIAENIPKETTRLKIVRNVEGEPLFDVWEGELALATSSGAITVDDASTVPYCVETDADSAPDAPADAGPDANPVI